MSSCSSSRLALLALRLVLYRPAPSSRCVGAWGGTAFAGRPLRRLTYIVLARALPSPSFSSRLIPSRLSRRVAGRLLRAIPYRRAFSAVSLSPCVMSVGYLVS